MMLSEEMIVNVIERIGTDEIISQIDEVLLKKGSEFFNEKYGLLLDMVLFDSINEIHLLDYSEEKESEKKSTVTCTIQVDYFVEGLNYWDGEYNIVESDLEDSVIMDISYIIYDGAEQEFRCIINDSIDD